MTGAEVTITFLGTGSAVPDVDRQQSCIALRHKNGLVLFDCGEGSQYALRKNKISTRKEFVIWISHLHSDHFLGIPGLLASFQLLAREEEITIVGPKGLLQTVQNLVLANYVRTSYDVKVVEMEPGDEFSGNGYKLKAMAAKHDGNALSVLWEEDEIAGKVNMDKLDELNIPPGPHITDLQNGETIEYGEHTVEPEEVIGKTRKGRTVFYSGDTAYNEQIIPSIKNCDIMIHEASYPSDMEELAEERMHSTVKEAAMIAKAAKAEKLIMTHISPRIQDFAKEEAIARALLERSEFAHDGKITILEYPYARSD